jgi:hypothetical protein
MGAAEYADNLLPLLAKSLGYLDKGFDKGRVIKPSNSNRYL